MSNNATLLLARRSIRARLGRLIAIAFAIVIGVAFVVGTFVLADSFRNGFSDLLTDVNDRVDLQVRSELAFGDELGTRDPIDESLVQTVAEVPGVGRADGSLQRNAVVLDAEGNPVLTNGAPTFGISWDASDGEDLDGIEIKGPGEQPVGSGQVAIDKATADREDFAVGDTITVVTEGGVGQYEITALVGVGESDGFFGAGLVAFDPATAVEVFDTAGVVDTIDIQLADGADGATVDAAVADVLPDNIEVVDNETLNDEAESSIDEIVSAFRTGLLVFAFVTTFVSAFLINNVFAITIGQRLRELALIRAVGGSGSQVRRLIVSEAVIMSIVATIVGIGGGVLVARGLLAVFNAAGAGFPDMPTVLRPTTVVIAFIVGVGVTLAAVFVPARRASRIPPVAAMRPELGFDAINTRRLVVGTTTFVVGVMMTLIGLFLRPGGVPGLIALAGGGALLVFLGAASVSSTIARPMTRFIGAPVARVFGAPGQLAQQNAGRAPRRTAATAATLMISVALVSAAAVFASSLQSSFTSALDRGVQADLVVKGEGFSTLPPSVAATLADVPEIAGVSGIRTTSIQVGGKSKNVGVVDGTGFPLVIDIDVTDGGYEGLDEDGVMVQADVADENDLSVGDTVDAMFQNGQERTLTVRGLYADAAFVGANWLVSQDVLGSIVTAEQADFFVFVTLADGVDEAAGRTAIEQALVDSPQAEIQTTEQFKEDQAAQIDQLLVIITVLLGFSIAIAILGISITLGLAVFERTREIGLMRAVGMTKRQTRRMVRWEAIVVSTFGALVGIVLGTGLGVALVLALPASIVDTVAFSTSTIVAILVGAVVAGGVAALYPAAKASRMNVLDAIATE